MNLQVELDHRFGFHSGVIWLPFVEGPEMSAYLYLFSSVITLSEESPPMPCLKGKKALLLVLSQSVGPDDWESPSIRNSAGVQLFYPGATRILWYRFVWFLAFSNFNFLGLLLSGFLGTAKKGDNYRLTIYIQTSEVLPTLDLLVVIDSFIPFF